MAVSHGTSGKASGCARGPGGWSRKLASSNQRVPEMAYKRGSGCPSPVILLRGSRGGEDVSEVCGGSLKIARETNLTPETKALL